MLNSDKGFAVITGASAGIGAVYADRLARRGHDLVLVGRNRTRLADVSKAITENTSRTVRIVVADLNNKTDLQVVEGIVATDPNITMLVNNAGVGALEPLLHSQVDTMESMIDLNVTALTRLTYAVAPAFVERGGGSIINIGSIVAIAPEILNGVYGATKAYVLALSLSLHKELSVRNVRVQAVLPGATATDFWSAAGGSLHNLPSAMVMKPDDLVDAALVGFDQGEIVTIPALPDPKSWEAYESARQRMIPNLSLSSVAPRYQGLSTG